MAHPDTASPIDVWIVEDDPGFRASLCELLIDTPGFACSQSFGSVEALLAELNHRFAPDVLLMDVSLPGMTGIEGLERLRRLAPSLPVLMCTIHDDHDRIFRALCGGACGYLLKTAPPELIVAAIREVHVGGAAMSGAVARRVLGMLTQMAGPRWDYGLTERERVILEHLVAGETKEAIAAALSVSFHTVDSHIRNVYVKLHVRTRSDAVAKAVRERLV